MIGFAISEIFSGWGEQIRHRARRRLSALQLVASSWILAFAVRYLWIQWWARSVDWSFGDYALSIAPAGLLALTAHVAHADPDPAVDAYERSRRPLCLLLALLALVLIARAVVTVQPDPATLRAIVGIDATVFVVFGVMGLSTDRRVHWIGWSLLWAAGIVATVRLGGHLGG